MTAAALAAAIYDRLHVTHQWRRTNLSPRFWLIGGPIRPCADRKTNRTLQLRQDTPPNAYARDSLLVADLLARGSPSLAAFPGALPAPSGKIGHRTRRLQLRGQPRHRAHKYAPAPRSHLIPCGNHRRHNGWGFRNQSRTKIHLEAAHTPFSPSQVAQPVPFKYSVARYSAAKRQSPRLLRRYVSITQPFRALASARIRSMSSMRS